MNTKPAQELDLDGLDPWSEGDPIPNVFSLASPPTSPPPEQAAQAVSPRGAKNTSADAGKTNGSPLSPLKAPAPRPFKTAPLTAPLSSLKDKEKRKDEPLSPVSPSTAPTHSSPLHTAHTLTVTSSASSLIATRSQSHPLALDDLARGAAALLLDEDDYSYGAYARTTGAVVNSSSVHSRHRTPLNRSRSGSVATPYKELDIRDVTRPALNRMTSETERQLSVGSWSAASSENGNGIREDEMDFIVHTITPSDSLPGISLRYGIDLPSLRKTNRLWPSDPIHLRTEVYIPVDACRPTSSGDHVERDGQGRAVLVRRRSSVETETDSHLGSSAKSDATVAPPDEVLTIVRLPKSKMRFFPKSASAKPRSSLESDLGRSADSLRLLTGSERAKRIVRHRPVDGIFPTSSSGPSSPTSPTRSHAKSISEDLGVKKSTRKVVRLRPPTATPPPPRDATLAARLTQLFNVPPPPAHQQPPIRIPPQPAQTAATPPPLRPELVEMDTRPQPTSSAPSPRRKRPPTDKKRD